jgi:hypothetical protein
MRRQGVVQRGGGRELVGMDVSAIDAKAGTGTTDNKPCATGRCAPALRVCFTDVRLDKREDCVTCT